ncbi:RsmB/NOP family class I SAM-dependent RNA methyltransferase [Pararhizobium haloflavum]|uniref:RsmB/NOP family class I SAM-dependent RNA methyltransferase n=1 Tax=Pararhizobium haloflavum TaxID=2037914 RepID=UPI001FE202B5|nr:RsmB/NOP family class I SAM-dependent RNA methyltransferase [Pararhizobium haloflavum]
MRGAAARAGKPTSSSSVPVKAGLETRRTAAKLLAAVIDRKVSLDGLLDVDNGNAAYRALADGDRALARAILLAGLRHLGKIEAALGRLIDKPLPEGARSLHMVLVVAATQILYLDVPDRAAVDLAVEQANGDPRNRRFSGLINAVLRRLAREKGALLPAVADVPDAPGWFVDRLKSHYGDAAAKQILEAHGREPPIDLTVKSDAEGWAARLSGIVLPTGSVRLAELNGPVSEMPGFADGAWWVQDAAASIPARLMGAIAGKEVADLCAAPGGKTAQLAQAGANVTAYDLSANRLKRLKYNLQRLGLQAECRVGNFMTEAPESSYDAILLDPPCSSTGTVRRHPDVVWTKGPDDIAKLADLQEKMVRRALALVRPGGRVVFSNCSLDPSEGEHLVDRVLSSVNAVRLEPVTPDDLPGLEGAITRQGAVRTTPAMLETYSPRLSGLDGFFAAILVRTD